ncbi:unnamed protein product [Cyclocybe aegerita]|uniref:Uncharacterized protein n=1 Tax=Cyclocybe aegerita TaxID=1973307 RepID=A0A8S0W5A6_CYCAE|nr:unnamed protein product [Cyclocybe aegerita]
MSSSFNPVPSPSAGPTSAILTFSFSSSGRIFFSTPTPSATLTELPSVVAVIGVTFISSVTPYSSDQPAPTTSEPSNASASQSTSGLNTGETIAIVVVAAMLVLAVATVVAFKVVRRRQLQKNSRSGYDQGSESGRSIESSEKYSDVKDTPYTESRRSFIETRGIAPLLDPQAHYSPFDNDRRNSQTGDAAPLHSSEYESEGVCQEHAATLADATPRPQSTAGTQLETVALHPPSAPSRTDVKLQPLIIPDNRASIAATFPTRRPSRTRRSVRSSKHASRALDGGYDSDDSASLYSQASAGTQQSVRSTLAISASTIQAFPLPNVPISSSPAHTPDEDGILRGSPRSLFDPVPLPPADSTEDGVERSDTLVVASLLKSRTKHISANQPSRSSSLVSHIERNGSIKPAISPIGEEGERETARERYLRMKKEQAGPEQYIIAPPMHATKRTPARSSRPPSTLAQPAEEAHEELPAVIPVTPTQTAPLRPKRSPARP